MMKIFYTTIFSFCILACQNGLPEKEKSIQEVSMTNNAPDSVLIEAIGKEEEDEEPDFVSYPDAYSNNIEFTSDIILNSMMHAGEVPKNYTNKNWYGLFSHNNSAYSLRRVEPNLELVFDPVMDVEGEDPTGVSYSVQGDGDAIILFSCAKSYKADTLNCPLGVPDKILVNTSHEFMFNEQSYRLFATGKQLPDTEGWEGTQDYRLFIEEIGPDYAVKQTLLMAKPYFDECSPSILFIGDIDGDNKIDMVVDVSAHYNAFEPTLYLSAGAGIDQVLKIAGIGSFTGC